LLCGDLSTDQEEKEMEFLRDIGPMELGLILLIILVVFGAGKMPQIGGALGKSIREFRKASRGEYDDEKSAPDSKPEQAASEKLTKS
jgi:sec-independent protein translocase protein TatA